MSKKMKIWDLIPGELFKTIHTKYPCFWLVVAARNINKSTITYILHVVLIIGL